MVHRQRARAAASIACVAIGLTGCSLHRAGTVAVTRSAPSADTGSAATRPVVMPGLPGRCPTVAAVHAALPPITGLSSDHPPDPSGTRKLLCAYAGGPLDAFEFVVSDFGAAARRNYEALYRGVADCAAGNCGPPRADVFVHDRTSFLEAVTTTTRYPASVDYQSGIFAGVINGRYVCSTTTLGMITSADPDTTDRVLAPGVRRLLLEACGKRGGARP